jgi:hypothetical protein
MRAEVTANPGTLYPDQFSAEYFSEVRGRWHYVQAGGGPRSRIGDHLPILEATLALGAVIGRFEICFPENEFPRAVPLTLIAGGPVRGRRQAREPGTVPRRGANADV